MNDSLQRCQNGCSRSRMNHVRHVALRSWLLFAFLVLFGCGQDVPPATVEGTLRMNGKPVDNCLITFLPESAPEAVGPHSTGVTDQRGYYRLRLPDQREGAVLGWHRVVVQDLSVSTGVRRRDHGTIDQETAEGAPPPIRQSRVPPSYGTAQTTPLREEIKTGSQVIDFTIP